MRLLVLITLLTVSATALACEEPNTPAVRRSALEKIAQDLGRVASFIESVPPDVARYIDNESENALLSQNQSRFSALVKNKYYYPHQFHKDYEKVDVEIKSSIVSYKIADEVSKIARSATYVATLEATFSDYLEYDGKRQKRYLSDDQAAQHAFTITTGKIRLLRILDCAARQIREP